MGLFSFLRRSRLSDRPSNITVYHLSEIIDGVAYSKPIGSMPRFSDDYEASLNSTHNPKPSFGKSCYIEDIVEGKTAILFWQSGRIEAINFLAESDALEISNLTLFPQEDLDVLDRHLTHFPRRPT